MNKITEDPFGNPFEFTFELKGDMASGDVTVGYTGGEVFIYDEFGYVRVSVNNIKAIASTCDERAYGDV